MLLHIPDILSADQVADFRRRLDAADWTDGRETVGHLGAQAKHNQQLPEASRCAANWARSSSSRWPGTRCSSAPRCR